MDWPIEYSPHGARLHHFAILHDQYPFADMIDHPQVVGNEQARQPQTLFQVIQQLKNLGLHRNIQGRHRLIADQDLRLAGQGAGDGDALTLAAGQLDRAARQDAGIKTYQFQ